MQLHKLLAELGCSDKQTEIFLLLYQYGAKPASTISKMIGIERTSAYKMSQTLVRKGLLAETTKNGVKQFYVPSEKVLSNLIEQQQKSLEQTASLLPLAEAELQQFDQQRVAPLPQIRFFEGKAGMEAIYADMEEYIVSEGFIVVKFFASNTLESQSATPVQLRDYSQSFFKRMKEKDIHLEAYLGNGILMLEQVMKTYDISAIDTLPAGHTAVHLFVVGEVFYIVLYKAVPFAIKIQNRDLADVMHFFFKQMG